MGAINEKSGSAPKLTEAQRAAMLRYQRTGLIAYPMLHDLKAAGLMVEYAEQVVGFTDAGRAALRGAK